MSTAPASPQLGEALKAKIIAAVDSIPDTKGAGIILQSSSGQLIECRGGPRVKYLYITPKATAIRNSPPIQKSKEEPGFWDRWGDAIMNCGSATASGAVIYFTGGTATVFVGTVAVASSAACGISVGKGIAYDDWQEFEKYGGGEYKAWIAVETGIGLVSLLGGAKGAVSFIKSWKQVGKLGQLKKAIGGKGLTRKEIVKRIQKIDPSFRPIMKGAGYTKKATIILKGNMVLKNARFVTLSAAKRNLIVSAIGDALTIGNSKGTLGNAFDFILTVVSE